MIRSLSASSLTEFDLNSLEEVKTNLVDCQQADFYKEAKPVFSLQQTANNFAVDFFKNEPHFSAETQKFVKAVFDPKNLVSTLQLTDLKEIEVLFDQLQLDVSQLIVISNKINFSKGYEKEALSFPSVSDMQELVKKTKTVKENFNKIKKNPLLKKRFNILFNTFLLHIEDCIRTQACQSRNLQLEKVSHDSKLEPEEKEYQLAIIKMHIHQLNQKKGQHWIELKSLLNLQRLESIARQPTQKELNFFTFITLVYDENNPKECVTITN